MVLPRIFAADLIITVVCGHVSGTSDIVYRCDGCNSLRIMSA